jgi:hypothetical protein
MSSEEQLALPDLARYEAFFCLLNGLVDMALAARDCKESMSREKAFDAKSLELVQIRPVALHPGTFNVDDSQDAAIKDNVSCKDRIAPIYAGQETKGVPAVAAHMDCPKGNARGLELATVSKAQTHRARRKPHLGGVRAL